MISATGSRGILQERCRKVTGSCRKTPETAGTWKQYSDRKLSGFFPVNSRQILVLSGRNRPEIIRKNPKIFRPEYCFHKITGITRNRQFPDRVIRPGIRELHTWYCRITISRRKRILNRRVHFFPLELYSVLFWAAPLSHFSKRRKTKTIKTTFFIHSYLTKI